MTCSVWKKIETISAILAFIGFIIMFGAAGNSDYMDEIGQYYPFSETVKLCVIGLLMCVPAVIVSKIEERWDLEDDSE